MLVWDVGMHFLGAFRRVSDEHCRMIMFIVFS